MDNSNNINNEANDNTPPPYPNNPPNSRVYSTLQNVRHPTTELNGIPPLSTQPESAIPTYPPSVPQLSTSNTYGYPMPSLNGGSSFPQLHQPNNSSGGLYMNYQSNNIAAERYGGQAEIPIPSAVPDSGNPPATPLPPENGILSNSALLQMLNKSSNFSGLPTSGPPNSLDGTLPSITQEQILSQGPLLLNQLNSVAEFLAAKGDFPNAIKYYERITGLDPENGAAWTALGHCYLLIEELYKAFTSYQKALYSLTDVRDPQLWYGIGLLYDKVKGFDNNSLKLMNMQYQL
jgi:tetratricopeptide (TPR) repeat protein